MQIIKIEMCAHFRLKLLHTFTNLLRRAKILLIEFIINAHAIRLTYWYLSFSNQQTKTA